MAAARSLNADTLSRSQLMLGSTWPSASATTALSVWACRRLTHRRSLAPGHARTAPTPCRWPWPAPPGGSAASSPSLANSASAGQLRPGAPTGGQQRPASLPQCVPRRGPAAIRPDQIRCRRRGCGDLGSRPGKASSIRICRTSTLSFVLVRSIGRPPDVAFSLFIALALHSCQGGRPRTRAPSPPFIMHGASGARPGWCNIAPSRAGPGRGKACLFVGMAVGRDPSRADRAALGPTADDDPAGPWPSRSPSVVAVTLRLVVAG